VIAQVKADTLEDLPTREDNEHRSNKMIEQAVMFQFRSPLQVSLGKPNEPS
jgi:hypothetical protein